MLLFPSTFIYLTIILQKENFSFKQDINLVETEGEDEEKYYNRR